MKLTFWLHYELRSSGKKKSIFVPYTLNLLFRFTQSIIFLYRFDFNFLHSFCYVSFSPQFPLCSSFHFHSAIFSHFLRKFFFSTRLSPIKISRWTERRKVRSRLTKKVSPKASWCEHAHKGVPGSLIGVFTFCFSRF